MRQTIRMKNLIQVVIYFSLTIGLIAWVSREEKLISQEVSQPETQKIPVADIQLADGTSILNAQSGKDWSGYNATGVYVYDYQDTVIIDDSDTSRIFYSAKDGYLPHKWTISNINKWKPDTVTGNCNCSFTRGPWDYMIIKFTNTKRVEWWGEKMPHHGMVNIYFDESGWEQVNDRRTLVALNYDTYSPVPDPMVLHWAKDSLDRDKVYELYIIPTGNKNNKSTGTYVVNRGFKLINPSTEVIVPDTVYIIDTVYITKVDTLVLWDTVFLTPKYYILPDTMEIK